MLQELSERLRRFERTHRPQGCVSTGTAGWDRLLPDGGVPAGSLVEWLAATGSGAGTLAMRMAARCTRGGRGCVVIDREGTFYPPAARRLGHDLTRLVVVRPASERETLWALEQSLRCTGVACVAARVERMTVQDFRRLKLAAECGGGVGLLLRPERGATAWAELRFAVRTVAQSEGERRLQVEMRHRRGTQTVRLDVSDETGAVRVVPELAAAAGVRRAAGA